MSLPPMLVDEILARTLDDREELEQILALTRQCRQLAAAGDVWPLARAMRERDALHLQLNPLAAMLFHDWTLGRVSDAHMDAFLALPYTDN